MKMQEVCQKTGLTERTVRYYMERGLVHPAASLSESGRRMDYSFDAGHVAELRDIALLREYGFSIDAILEMRTDPSRIEEQVKAQAGNIQVQEDSLRGKKEILSGLCQSNLSDVARLAESLRREQHRLSLPDLKVSPAFRRLDGPEDAEGGEDAAVLEREIRRQGRKKTLLLWGAAILLVLAIGAGLFAWRAGRTVYSVFTPLSSAVFSEKWQEDGALFARLTFKDTPLEGVSCVVRFEDFPLYWAVVPGHEYMAVTLTAEVPLKKGKEEGLIAGDNTVDFAGLLRDEALFARYVTVKTIQGE